VFKPSTTPDDIVPLARNQLRIRASCGGYNRMLWTAG
jgi:hypothetical protein